MKLTGLVRLALVVGAIDLASTLIYWGWRGVAPGKVLASMAGWVASPVPPGWPTYVLGAAVDFGIYAVVVLVFHRLFRNSRQARMSWAPVGALYGIACYVAIFHVVIPLLIFPAHLANPPMWVATCVLLHAFVIGPLIAWSILRPDVAALRALSPHRG